MNRIFVIFALLLAFVAQVHAQKEQSFMLTGTVFDEFNEPVPGAEEHTSELQSRLHHVCRLLLEKIKINQGWE